MTIRRKTVNITDIIETDSKARLALSALLNQLLNEENQFKTNMDTDEALIYLHSAGVKFKGPLVEIPPAVNICDVDSSLFVDFLARGTVVEKAARRYAKTDTESILNAGGNFHCDLRLFNTDDLYGVAQEAMRILLSVILTNGLKSYVTEEINQEVVLHVLIRKLDQHRAINCGVSLDLLQLDYWPVESESRNRVKTQLAFVNSRIKASFTPKWHRLPSGVLEESTAGEFTLPNEISLLVATFDHKKPAIQYNAPSKRELLSMIALLM